MAGQLGLDASTTYSLSVGQEIGTGISGNGLAIITDTRSGDNVIISVQATVFNDSALLQSSGSSFSSSLTTSGKIGINRKTTNGPIFIVNNKANETSVRVRMITSFMGIGV